MAVHIFEVHSPKRSTALANHFIQMPISLILILNCVIIAVVIINVFV